MHKVINPLEVQVGGRHYADMALQPVEFSTVNCLDPCAFSILKYLSRHRTKNGLDDIEKADHFVDLRIWLHGALIRGRGLEPPEWVIPAGHYCFVNDITGWDRDAIVALGAWAQSGEKYAPVELRTALRHLRGEYPGEPVR